MRASLRVPRTGLAAAARDNRRRLRVPYAHRSRRRNGRRAALLRVLPRRGGQFRRARTTTLVSGARSIARTKERARQIEFSYLLLTIIGVVSRPLRDESEAALITESCAEKDPRGSSAQMRLRIPRFRERLYPRATLVVDPADRKHPTLRRVSLFPRDYSRRPRILASLIALRAPRATLSKPRDFMIKAHSEYLLPRLLREEGETESRATSSIAHEMTGIDRLS